MAISIPLFLGTVGLADRGLAIDLVFFDNAITQDSFELPLFIEDGDLILHTHGRSNIIIPSQKIPDGFTSIDYRNAEIEQLEGGTPIVHTRHTVIKTAEISDRGRLIKSIDISNGSHQVGIFRATDGRPLTAEQIAVDTYDVTDFPYEAVAFAYGYAPEGQPDGKLNLNGSDSFKVPPFPNNTMIITPVNEPSTLDLPILIRPL